MSGTANAPCNWPALIGELIQVHRVIRSLDDEGIWSNDLPSLASEASALEFVDREIEGLDPQYRAFLQSADGWDAFFQWVDLFGTSRLMCMQDRSHEYLERLHHVLKDRGLKREDLLTIAMTRPGYENGVPDLFVIVRSHHPRAGKIFWLAEDIVDEFRDFEDFFLCMIEYNRREEENLRAEKGS